MNIVLGRICVGRSHVMFYLLGDIVFLFFVVFFFKPLGMGGADGSLICLLPTTRKETRPPHSYCPLSLGPTDKVISSFTVCHGL